MSRIFYVEEFKYTKNGEKKGPSGPLSAEQLASSTGIKYRQVNLDPKNQEKILADIPETKQYDYSDVIEVSPQSLGADFSRKVASFNREHIHGDDEVRFFLEGSAFYEIRDLDDNWIRMNAFPGDFLSIPKGVFHRFFLDKNQHVKAMRLFAKNPVWEGYYRTQGADHHPARLAYLAKMGVQNEKFQGLF